MLFARNEAIEGSKVDMASRDPLCNRGRVRHNGCTCHRYVATFNVSAQITDTVEGRPVFEPDAKTNMGIELKCDKAICHSSDGRPSHKLTMGSSTHQINKLHFSARTSVRIEMPHEELINGAAKRIGLSVVPALPRR